MNIFGLDPSEAASRVALLTKREKEVAEMLAHGIGTWDIANVLSVSKKYVEHCRLAIWKKLKTNPTGLGRVWFAARSVSNG